MAVDVETDRWQLWIDGEWVDAGGNDAGEGDIGASDAGASAAGPTDSMAVTSPYTGDRVAEVPAATPEDVDRAYEAATRAAADWRETPPAERAETLQSIVETVRDRREEIVETLIREAGSTRLKANDEVDAALGILTQARGYPGRVGGTLEESNVPGKVNHVHRDPVGVVTAITAWNYPFHLASRVIGPAIALGNAVVLKPAPDTPVAGGLLPATIYEEAGVPEGLVNVVTGRDDVIGDHVAGHQRSDMLAFTGSTAVGRHVGKLAVDNLAFPALELGGNSPQVVLDDADVEQAARAGAWGSYRHAGQVCTAINRHVVHEDVVDEYVSTLVAEAEALSVADGFDPDAAVGPMINETQRDRLHELVTGSIDAGATLERGGDYDGLVYEPTVLTGVGNDVPIAANEHFGPVAAVLAVPDEEAAVEVANDTDRGLSSSIWTDDRARAQRLADRIEAGMVHVNDHTIGNEAHVPFGGKKASGIGRYNDEEIIRELTETRCVAVQETQREYEL